MLLRLDSFDTFTFDSFVRLITQEGCFFFASNCVVIIILVIALLVEHVRANNLK